VSGPSISPVTLYRSLAANRQLIGQLSRREVAMRYKGSFLGILWSLITPLFMLGIYTFVFTFIMHPVWGTGANSRHGVFAFAIFAGLIVFTVFAETFQKAPTLITNSPSYVKKVVFPLEILPVVALCAALIQGAISMCVLLPGWLIYSHTVSKTIWLFPLTLLPLCKGTLGISWIVASLGVFIRDIQHPLAVLVQALAFVSGIFFSVEVLPHKIQTILSINPLVPVVIDARNTLLWGVYPEWSRLAVSLVASFVVMQVGYWWFQRSRGAFADVL
jgi:lipopolysaccharide transport system permease protein